MTFARGLVKVGRAFALHLSVLPSDTSGRSDKQKKQLSWTIVDEFCGAVRSMDKRLMNKHFFRFCKYLFRVCLFGLYATMLYGKTLSVYALETGNSTKKTNRSVAPVVKKTNRSVAPVAKKTNRSVAPVARLEDWRFYPEALQLEMSLSRASQPRHFYLAQPPRIVIDLPGTKLGRIPTQQNFSGPIRTIRVSQLNADVTRIVMDVAPGTVIDPNQVQLQPISRENPNRWVLRPLIASNGTYLPQGNLPSLPSNTPLGVYNPPQPPGNLPSGMYNPPQPPGNLPSGMYNPPQPPGNLPSGVYNPPQPPGNLPSGVYNPPQPPGNLPSGVYNPPQPPGNLPSGMYNPPQPPGNLPSGMYNPPQAADFSVPPPLTTLPPTSTNFPQTPSVRVPPFTPNNPSQLPSSIVPPPSFPYQPRNSNNSIPSVGMPNFPVPNAPSYPPSSPNSGVIEFGEPFPNPTR
ncbi:AMIN domain-containing protein [Scytonema sp. HK-05]|uniref:AMIN domain-containing protein n=1 Tax=Scytonema sp. HK-05 TaxID=1137095 RepID=UPI00095DFE82|nr:hypothetical protein NIES2130_09715 [Scytonema sp. HK-05]